VVRKMSIIVASEEVVEDNYYGRSSCSLIVKFALLRCMSDMSLILVRAPSISRKPP
jgi:glutamine amidotransferase PdxT